jgi:hypothetical protein
MYIFRTTNVEIENHKAGIKFKISTNETIWIFKLSDEEQYATWEKAPAWTCIWKIILQSNFMQYFYVEIYYERNTTERLYKKTFKQGVIEQISGSNPFKNKL